MIKVSHRQKIHTLKRQLIWALFFLFSTNCFSQTTLASDNFGTTTQNPISRTGWTAAAGGSSAWELRTTAASSGYTGASGGANVFTNLSGVSITKTLTYDNSLSTVGYNNIIVSFGNIKTGTVPTLAVQYSTDGVTYNTVSNITIGTTWALSSVSLPVGAENIANLRIRFEIVTNNNSSNNFRIDDFKVTGDPVAACSEPTVQPSAVSASAIGMNSMTISWTNGNGANRLVVVKPISNPSFAPIDGTSYTANSVYGQGSSVGYGWVVYNGTGTSVNVTGLTANTAYYFLIYEFNCTNYDTIAPAAVNATTLGGFVINEIMVNPAGPNDGTNAPNTSEWIEFYNATSAPIDISCWFFTDGDFAVTFPSVTIVPAGGYFVVASAAGSGLTPNLDWALCGCTSGPSTQVGIFTNGNEQVLLYNASGVLVDAVIWGGGQLPGSMTTTALSPCASQSVTFPAAGSSYDDIGTVSDGIANEAVYDGSSNWQQTGSATIGSTNGADPLPIELISFEVKPNNDNIEISWATTTEINNDYFTLERSKNGVNFTSIAIVAGAGNTTTTQYYSNLDFEPWDGINYYRLKQTDFDGNYSYSAIKAVNYSKTDNLNAIIYPNPTTNELNVLFSKISENQLNIQIYDVLGKLIFNQNQEILSNKATISTDWLSKGLYTISIITKSYSHKQLFIKE